MLGYDAGKRRSLSLRAAQGAVPEAPTPANYRIGLLEPDYPHEIVSGFDVVEYYATYGHAANIKLFHLNAVSPACSGNPYELNVVPRELVSADHYTMSASGVVHVHGGGEAPEFIPLGTWLRELSVYNLMRQLRVFRLYLPRKMFRIWRNAAHRNAFDRARERLEASFFFAKPLFCTALMDAKRHVHEITSVSLLSVMPPAPVWVRTETSPVTWKLVDGAGSGDTSLT